MSYITQITLPTGTTYDLQDAGARQLISELTAGGVTITVCTGAADTPNVTKYGTANGELAASSAETNKIYFVPATNNGNDYYNEWIVITPAGGGSKQWEKLGDTRIDLSGYVQKSAYDAFRNGISTLGTLAGKNSVSVTVAYQKASGSSTVERSLVTGGTVGATFSGTTASVSVNVTAEGSVTTTPTISFKTGNIPNITAAALAATPTFSGISATISTSYTPAGNVTSTPNITLGTTVVNSITDIGSLPSFTQGTYTPETYTVDGTTLKITASSHANDTFDEGSLPTKGSNTTVATGAVTTISVASQFTGTTATISASYKPEGAISKPGITLTSTMVQPFTEVESITAESAFTGTAVTGTGSFKPTGSISATFSPTTETWSHSHTINTTTATVNVTGE